MNVSQKEITIHSLCTPGVIVHRRQGKLFHPSKLCKKLGPIDKSMLGMTKDVNDFTIPEDFADRNLHD
jgi:hypothetical protein